MSESAQQILQHLNAVDLERERRTAVPGLQAKVMAVKSYQQRRFSYTYGDLLKTARYGAASRFFLDELYGPADFRKRDAQFARVVPGLVRLFPQEIVQTVATLAELHDLSEELDSALGSKLASDQVSSATYIVAWQATGRPDARERQIELTLRVADSLDKITRKPLIRGSLRLMRGPARAAGLGELQTFLESGFDTFKAMRGAEEFLATIGSRERALATGLFAASTRAREFAGKECSVFALLPEDEI